jgi:PASTA domain
VTILVEPGSPRDPLVMTKIVNALDRAWTYYSETTGRTPAALHSLNGRDEIAEVSSTSCQGAACSYLGATGTEIQTQYFEWLYEEVARSNEYDQVPFYELGRSFWFWSPQLEFHIPEQDPVVTGFAVLMRFESMAAAGVTGAPFNGPEGTPFPTFTAQVEALSGEYEADPELTFAGTLAQAKSPDGYGGTDFWASLMMQLAQRHGGQAFLSRFFQHVITLPPASSTAGAVANWEQAATYAACVDLSPVFYTRWGFPQPDGTVRARPPASAIPEPSGECLPQPQATTTVPRLIHYTLRQARRRLARADCVLGAVRKRIRGRGRVLRVVSQRPGAGNVVVIGSSVSVVLSRTKRHRHRHNVAD